jgi:RNA exonuclease 4
MGGGEQMERNQKKVDVVGGGRKLEVNRADDDGEQKKVVGGSAAVGGKNVQKSVNDADRPVKGATEAAERTEEPPKKRAKVQSERERRRVRGKNDTGSDETKKAAKNESGEKEEGKSKSRRPLVKRKDVPDASVADQNWKKLMADVTKEHPKAGNDPRRRVSQSATAVQKAIPIEQPRALPRGQQKHQHVESFEQSSPHKHAEESVVSLTPDKLTPCVALDCEMVGVGADGERSVLARVTIVNYHGQVLYDKYVRPRELVTDFRTEVSGVAKKHLRNAADFLEVQKEVSDIVKGRVVVGHALSNDFRALLLPTPPFKMLRDSARCSLFKTEKVKHPKLSILARHHLGLVIQEDRHSSVEDAKTVMLLYRRYQKDWDAWCLNPGKHSGIKAVEKLQGKSREEPSV